tara:strand:+ start:385 stop:1461 length:1077 start_codon:yes stop_codon:yes gene_type:complete
MAIIKPKQISSEFYTISGSFSGSFHGDGSDLTNLPSPQSNKIITGSISAEVNIDDIFLVKSGSTEFLKIDNIGSTTLHSLNITTSLTASYLTLEDENVSSDAGPIIDLIRNSPSPDNGDYLGQIKFKGENDADQEIVYAKITGKISDVTDTTEDGLIETAVKKDGANVIVSRQTGDALKLINGTSLEVAGNAHVGGTFLAGEDVLPNSDFVLTGGATSTIDPTTMAISSFMGQVIVTQATNESLNAGQLVYQLSNGSWGLADADSTSTSTNILGIALNTATSGNTIDVLIDGVVTILSSYITAGNTGNPLYVSTTAGSITNTAPTDISDVVRIIGHYINGGSGYSIITFKPDGIWVKL